MSGAVSDAKAVKLDDEAPEIEDAGDRKESIIQYSPNAKIPLPVVLIWICALAGLGYYAVNWYFPELSLWVK